MVTGRFVSDLQKRDVLGTIAYGVSSFAPFRLVSGSLISIP
jgi:hypothetical protein